MSTEIQSAINLLKATKETDSTWLYYAQETFRWYRLELADLLSLNSYLYHPDQAIRSDAYSHWCSTGPGHEMPPQWEPGMTTYGLCIEDEGDSGFHPPGPSLDEAIDQARDHIAEGGWDLEPEEKLLITFWLTSPSGERTEHEVEICN